MVFPWRVLCSAAVTGRVSRCDVSAIPTPVLLSVSVLGGVRVGVHVRVGVQSEIQGLGTPARDISPRDVFVSRWGGGHTDAIFVLVAQER